MIRRPPRATRTDTLFPYPTLFRSGNASTAGSPSGTITYNPRDGVFTVSIADDLAGVSREVRFQDPAHRTDFDPAIRPVREVPDLAGFNYLAAADGDNGSTSSFFYQQIGRAHV